jgi:hypothetical protein
VIYKKNILLISIQTTFQLLFIVFFKKILSCIKKLLPVGLTFRAFRRIINVSEAAAFTGLGVKAFLKLAVFEKLLVLVIFLGVALEG